LRLMQPEPHTMTKTMPAMEPFTMMRNLMRWDPFRDLGFDLEPQASFTPSFDIRETPECYIFEADLPGIGQQDLDISMAGNRLTITGKREGSSKGQGENFYTAERSFGCFCRAFSLPDGVDPNGITADLKEGVLTLTLPKSAAAQSKKINIAMNAQAESEPAGSAGM